MTGYETYPDHPLHDVPREVLEAARSVTVEAGAWKDLDPDIAEALADAVVMAALPSIRAWLGAPTVDLPDLADDELAAVEARCQRATPGPWWSWVEGRDGHSGDSFIGRGIEGSRHPDLYLSTDPGHQIESDDYDFIAAARQDIPRLVAEVRRLRSAT